MAIATVVTFDIADGSFDFYTNDMWNSQLSTWRQELEDDGFEGSEALDAEELIEMIWGEEMFFETIPEIK
jgi:hypothetical protein|tara:strand:+ start:772 stop:981 length:210 start_codon:yes stop_codon:yes gene_type:complete